MFELHYNKVKLSVQQHTVAGQTVYRVVFADRRTPLIITSIILDDDTPFWTSIPEGRQEEAAAIGVLISEHLNKNA